VNKLVIGMSTLTETIGVGIFHNLLFFFPFLVLRFVLKYRLHFEFLVRSMWPT
jgi:hypothetical protein